MMILKWILKMILKTLTIGQNSNSKKLIVSPNKMKNTQELNYSHSNDGDDEGGADVSVELSD